MKRTPGPWGLRGVQIRAEAGLGQHVATYQVSEADGKLLAAAPTLLEMLLDATKRLPVTERDVLLQRLVALGLIERSRR